MTRVDRRQFVAKTIALASASGAGLGLLACVREGSAPAVVTRPRVKWRLASSFPRSLDTIYGASEVFAARVESLTDGHFTVRAYPAGELVPGLQVLDSVQAGAVEVGHSASYYYTGKNPSLAFDCAVPFGLEARQQCAWLSPAGGGLDLMRAAFADFGVINFPGGNTGVQMGGWFRRKVLSLDDLKGLKMRIPGLGGQVMSRLGVTVQVIPGGDIFPALERGAIDATEWVGPYDDMKLGFHQIVKDYYYPGWWEPGPSLTFYVNRAAYDALPKDYQAVIECAAAEAGLRMMQDYDAKNPPALASLLKQGVVLHPFPDDVMKAAERAITEYLDETAAKDAAFAKVYEHWTHFRKESAAWFATAEFAYAKFCHARGV